MAPMTVKAYAVERGDKPAVNGRHSAENRVWGGPIHRLRGVVLRKNPL